MDLRAAASRLPVDRAIDADMASHHGLTTHERVLLLGGSPNLAENQLLRGEWESPHRGVYRNAAAPHSPEQDLLAAVYASGRRALASHLSGVWLWNLLARPPDHPHVSVPYERSVRHRGIVLHRSTDLSDARICERRGIPVTDPARTILDTAGIVTPGVTALLVDRAVSTKLVTVSGLVAVLERYGRRGRRGAGKLRTVLEERGVSAASRVPTVLESRMARLLRSIDAPQPVAEYPIAGGRWFLDFAWPEVLVAIEVDGWDGHAAYNDWLRNMEKRNWARENGWFIIEIAWDHIRERPDLVLARIEAALVRRSLAI